MSPEQLTEFNKMKQELKALKEVLDVPFIENAKRRIVIPEFTRIGVDAVISKEGTDTTSGTTQSVVESGSSTYTVAKIYDGTLIISDVDGNSYKLGYYTA